MSWSTWPTIDQVLIKCQQRCQSSFNQDSFWESIEGLYWLTFDCTCFRTHDPKHLTQSIVTASYFALNVTATCLAWSGGISIPGANKVPRCNSSSTEQDLFRPWLPCISDWLSGLLANWMQNWGSSLTDVQDWNIVPLSPLLLLRQIWLNRWFVINTAFSI